MTNLFFTITGKCAGLPGQVAISYWVKSMNYISCAPSTDMMFT